MSDKLSVDDILEQYSSKARNSKTDDFDLDSFLTKKPQAPKPEPVKPAPIKPAAVILDEAMPSEPKKDGKRAQENTVQVRIASEAQSEPVKPDYEETREIKAVIPEEKPEPAAAEKEAVQENASESESLDEIRFETSKPSEKKSSKKINTSVIEKLVQKKREHSDPAVTGTIPPVSRANVKDIDMGLEGKIIPRTEQLEIAPDATDEEKMAILEKRREKKVKNFVLDNAEIDGDENKEEVKEREKAPLPIDEFESFEQASHVLSDIGQLKSNIVIRLCVLLFTSLFAVYLTLANDFKLPIITVFSRDYSPEAFLFALTILGIISAFVSYTVIFSGLKKLFKLSADCDSLAAIGITVTTVSGIINLFSTDSIQTGNYHVFTAVAILGLLFNTLGKLTIVNRTERNFRFAAGEFEKHAFTKIEDEDIAYKFTKGTLDDFPELATTKKTEFVEDFLANSYSADISDDYSRKAAPIITIAAVIAAVLAFALDKTATSGAERLMVSLGAMCAVASMAASVAIMFIVNLPLARASKKYLQSSAVLLGYSAVDEYADTNSVLIDAEQLFPEGMVDLVNLKAMSSTLIEDCILYAASLVCQAGGVMKPTFYKMLRGKTEMLFPVESYIYEDGLGLSGWIENKRVLFGSRELMENHSIEGLPTKAKEAEYSKGNIPMYLSISGVVSAIFFIRASANVTVSRWFQELTDRKITVVVRTADAFITVKYLSEMFDVNPDKIKLLPFRFYQDYEKERAYTPRVSSPMMCSGHFPSMAMLICGTKNIQMLSILGMTIQMTFSILGAVIVLAMLFMGSLSQLTASIAICYNLVCLAVTLLVQQFKKV
ncbi:MAG: hypothetical protein J6A55_08560 [Oscillospiraceae bacterium]|nr:hypothetical protein [Oscillospiraceae bacterium]